MKNMFKKVMAGSSEHGTGDDRVRRFIQLACSGSL